MEASIGTELTPIAAKLIWEEFLGTGNQVV